MAFNPLIKNNRNKRRKKITKPKINVIIFLFIVSWSLFLTIRSVINYKEITKIYELKKNEYETMSNELKKLEEELGILRRVLQEYEKIRSDNVLQTQPATDNISQEDSK